MSLSSARGIILSRKLSGEADYICSIFTRELGREMFIFKGLKKSKKRPPSASETGSIVNFHYYSKQGLPVKTISAFDLISTPSQIKISTLKIFTLYYIMEITDKTTGCGDKDERIYNLLISAVNSLGRVNNEINFALFFIARYLSIQGLLPEINGCSSCGEKFFNSFSMSRINLHLLCPHCASNDNIMIGSNALNFLIQSTREKYSSIDHSGYSSDDILMLLRVITEFIEHYYSVVIKSGELLLNSPSCGNSSKASGSGFLV